MMALRRRTAQVMSSTLLEGRLRRSCHVLSTSDANELVLLDLRSGRYFMLNDVGSRVWTLLTPSTTLRSIVEAIRREYAVNAPADESAVERDVRQLLTSFLAAGLIAAEGAGGSARHAPSPWVCAALLFVIRTGLKYGGLDRTRRVLMSRVRPATHDAHDRRLIDECVHSVALAAAFFPGRALCLERSLTLWYVLRSRGIPVELRLGVQTFPFAAHAWVSYQGNPLNDVREHVEHFQPLAALAS